MKVSLRRFPGNFNGKECYVQARAGALDEQRLVMTIQKLNVEGCVDFFPLSVLTSADCGKSWSVPREDPVFAADTDEVGRRRVGCDATPFLHKKTNTLVVVGTDACYEQGANQPARSYKQTTFYSAYHADTGCFSPIERIVLPDEKHPI